MDQSAHTTHEPDEVPPRTEPPYFVWAQEDIVNTGGIEVLVSAIERSHYAGIDKPDHVIILHDGTWTDVTMTITFNGTDEDDWMSYTLTCQWADQTETEPYSIDGRA